MKRLVLISGVCFVLCTSLLVSALAQNGRGRGGGRGTTCGDGSGWSKTEAEYNAWRAAEHACEALGGSSQSTSIIYSGCGLLDCRATACTTCIIPSLPPGPTPPTR